MPLFLQTLRGLAVCKAGLHWVQERQIKAVLYFGSNLISKESLAAFLASPYGQSIAVQSVQHKELMADFCEEVQNSDMMFGVMSL